MALNSLICADVSLRSCSLTHFWQKHANGCRLQWTYNWSLLIQPRTQIMKWKCS